MYTREITSNYIIKCSISNLRTEIFRNKIKYSRNVYIIINLSIKLKILTSDFIFQFPLVDDIMIMMIMMSAHCYGAGKP